MTEEITKDAERREAVVVESYDAYQQGKEQE